MTKKSGKGEGRKRNNRGQVRRRLTGKEWEGMKQGGERRRLVPDWEKQKVATLIGVNLAGILPTH